MIKKIEITNNEMSEKVLNIQIPSYKVEAELINYYDIPPLKETAESLRNCGETFFGYFINNNLAGVISYKKIDSILDIHRLMVHPDHFRKGIAKELLTFIEEENHIQMNEMIVSTGSKNTPAIRFYEKFGFSRSGELKVSEELSLTAFRKCMMGGVRVK